MKKLTALCAIFCFLLAALALTGCQGGGTTKTSEGQAFLGGDEGLLVSYISGFPPETIYDQGKFPFTVNLQVENRGEWDISDPGKAVISITGIDPGLFNNPLVIKDVGQSLSGKKMKIEGGESAGGIVQVEFPNFNYMGSIAGDLTFKIRSTICYGYGSKTLSKVCIKKDVYSTDSSVCVVSESKQAQNSGAPVHIDEIREDIAGQNRIKVEFKIKHVGKGKIFKKDSSCSNNFEDKDLVYLKLNAATTPAPECSGLQDESGNQVKGAEGYVKLINNERVISCYQAISSPGDFERPVDFTLTYDYSEFTDKDVTVKHIG